MVHQGRLSAVTREMRLRISGPHASVVVIAASTRVGRRVIRLRREPADEDRLGPALARVPRASLRRADRVSRRRAARCRSRRSGAMSKLSSSALVRPAAAKRSISHFAASRAARWRFGPMIEAAAARIALGALPASRAACAAASSGVPCRLTNAAIATSISFSSFSPPGSCSRARLTFASSEMRRCVEHRGAMQAADLRFRIHLRCARRVLERLTRRNRPDLPVDLQDLLVIGRDRADHGNRKAGRQAAMPWSEPNHGLSARLPSGSKSGIVALARMTAVSAAGNMRDVRDDRALRRAARIVGREEPVDAELLHEPAFLRLRVVGAARHRARMADRTRQPALPPAHHAGDHRLGEVRIRLRSSRPVRNRARRPCCAHRWRAQRQIPARRSGCRRPCRSK